MDFVFFATHLPSFLLVLSKNHFQACFSPNFALKDTIHTIYYHEIIYNLPYKRIKNNDIRKNYISFRSYLYYKSNSFLKKTNVKGARKKIEHTKTR